ncbi:hypothetical protein U8V72_11010 [Priestia filamentosa]|uniref:hypothetical protein n=1 Tax=Priestia filamentosa TaxID=1402861 RepID=UPI0039785338
MKKDKQTFFKKLLVATFIGSTLLSMGSQISGNFVYAEDKDGKAEKESVKVEKKMITAPGFFTREFPVIMSNCEGIKEQAQAEKEKKQEEVESGEGYNGYDEKAEDSFSISEKDKGRETKAVNELMGTAADAIVSPDQDKEPSKGLFGIGCGQFNFLNWLSKLITPVNVTNSEVVMGLVYKFQIAALGIGVLLVALFGLYYATGNETTDPIKFLIRGFFTLLLVYYLPYFAQDILNINNMLVYWISTDSISTPDGAAMTSGILVALVANTSLIISVVVNVLYLNAIPGVIFITLILLVLVVAFILKHVITIMFWWYARLLMIIFLLMLGPIFMIMMILPRTAGYGSKWVKFFVGEVFTQTSMVLGVYFAAHILSNLSTLNKAHNIGLIGDMMIVYGIFLLLGKIPHLSKRYIGEEFGGIGWADAQNVGKNVGEFAQKAGFALTDKITNLASKQSEARREGKRHELQKQVNEAKFKEKNGGTLSRSEKNAAERAQQKLKNMNTADKLHNRIASSAESLHEAYKKGKPGAGLKDFQKLRKQAAENAKAKDPETQKLVEGEHAGYATKLYADALDGENEVKKDLQKQMDKEVGRYNTEKHRIANDEKRARRRAEEEEKEFNAEEFDDRRKAAAIEHKKKMGELNAKMGDKDYIAAQSRKLQEAARGNVERMAAQIVGDGFENDFQKNLAISKKADELEAKYLNKARNQKEVEQAKKENGAKADINEKAQNYAQAMDSGVNALSSKLQEQGLGKAEANARAAQMIQSQSNIDNLRASNKNLLDKPYGELNGEEKEQLKGVESQIQKLESNMQEKAGKLPLSEVNSTLSPHMEKINGASKAYNEAISNHSETLNGSQNYGEVAIATNLLNNGGSLQSLMEQSSGKNAKDFTNYLEGMGVGNSAPGIVKALGGEMKDEVNFLNSASVNGPQNKQAVLNNFVDAAKTNIEPGTMSPQAIEEFGQRIGEAAWQDYTQTAPESKKFAGAASNVGSGIGFVQSVSNKEIGDISVSKMFEDAGISNPEKAAEQFVQHAPSMEKVIGETIETGNSNRSTFTASFAQATQGMDTSIQTGVQDAVWKEISKGHDMQSRTGNALGIAGNSIGTIDGIKGGTVTQEVIIESLANNSVPSPETVGAVIHNNAPEIDSAITTIMQSETPTKQGFEQAMAPVMDKVEAPIASAMVNNLWNDMSSSSSMQTPVGTRTSQALSSMSQSPIQIVQDVSSGMISQEEIVETFEEHGIPNPESAGQILVDSAPELNQVVTHTLNTSSPNGDSFRESAVEILKSGGMDTQMATSVAGNMWTDVAKGMSMDNRFSNAWSSTEQVVEQLSSQSMDVEVIIETLTENSIPNPKETATALQQGAPEIKEIIEMTVNAENPSMETAETKLQGVLGGVKNPEAKSSLISSILKDIGKKLTGNSGGPLSNTNIDKDKNKQ